MSIEFKECAVCHADGYDWFYYDEKYLINTSNRLLLYKNLANYSDFQLNAIKQGDYIITSELGAGQKYNDAVEVFKLFGFFKINDLVNEKNHMCSPFNTLLAFNDVQLLHVPNDYFYKKRRVTFDQLMAIGKLKRMMIERNII